jgi:hypothetical protein
MSAYRGVFESRPIRFAESTLTSGRSIACVRLRDQAHVFSAFTGRWHDRTVPADWRLALHERLAIFFHPALDTFGGAFMLDALTGQWHDLPATNVTLFRASVSASTVMWLFRRADQTTYLVTWSTHAPQFRFHQVQALPPLNNLGGGVGGADFVGAWDVCYSGLFDTVTPLGQAIASGADGMVAVAHDTVAKLYYCLGIGGASWVAMPPGSTVVRAGVRTPVAMVRLFAFGDQTLAFDGRWNTYTAVQNDRGQFPSAGIEGTLVGAVADVQTGRVDVYGAMTGQWHQPPADVLPEPPHPP